MSSNKTSSDVIEQTLGNLHESVEKIRNVLNVALNEDMNEIYNQELTIKEKVDYDLFTAYTLNTLYWLYLRTRGGDPNQNEVKGQLSRIKDYMLKCKQAHERNTIRPKVDVAAAKRFIKHGINVHHDESSEDVEAPKKKRKTFHE